MDEKKHQNEFNYIYTFSQLEFIPLDTVSMYTEFNYNPDKKELKIHIWLNPAVPLRYAWEVLANAFGHEALAWTREAERLVGNQIIRGSIFIGLKCEPHQVQNVLAALKEIDYHFLTLREGFVP